MYKNRVRPRGSINFSLSSHSFSSKEGERPTCTGQRGTSGIRLNFFFWDSPTNRRAQKKNLYFKNFLVFLRPAAWSRWPSAAPRSIPSPRSVLSLDKWGSLRSYALFMMVKWLYQFCLMFLTLWRLIYTFISNSSLSKQKSIEPVRTKSVKQQFRQPTGNKFYIF